MEALTFQCKLSTAVWSRPWVTSPTANGAYERDDTRFLLPKMRQNRLCDCQGTEEVGIELSDESVIAEEVTDISV